MRTCSVGGLKLDERLLALIVTWILTPRGSNQFVLTEEDLVYILHNDEDQNQLDPHHQGTHAKGHQVK